MQPISRWDICNQIDKAEQAYRLCWDILAEFKASMETGKHLRLMDFQPALAQAIHDLDRTFDAIRREERSLVETKGARNHSQFTARMAELGGFREAIDKAIRIGKGLGDAFAWIFYLGSLEMLPEQISKPAVSHTPPGVGGQGELAFVRFFPRFKHYLPIYHGITSFLRSGDFSLVDVRTLKVAALVELKTAQIAGAKHTFTLNIVGQNKLDDLSDGFTFTPDDEITDVTPIIKPDIPGFNDRLKRQIGTMGSVLKERAADKNIEQHDAYHTQELRELAKESAVASPAYKQAGPGLLLIALKMPELKLSERLLDPSAPSDFASKLTDLPKKTIALFNATSKFNSLIISQLHVSLPAGATPLFWWPCDQSFLQKIFFHELWVGTVFNPVHFAEKLTSRGFTIKGEGNPNRWSVYKTTGNMKATIEGFHYFLASIQYHLMREDNVIDMIEKVESAAKKARPNTRIALNITHRLA
ncbi:MAG: hypothetical protein PHS14_05915 [Elusimicrobia bacterium]|nr:hypothetical protein [Elusimicrobiota bacterium]